MTNQENHLQASANVPPVWFVRIISGFRDFLEKLRRKLAPPHVALLEMSLSFWYTQAIYVAAKLGVADHLKDGPRSIVELATATRTHAPSLYRLMRALASIGVFAEDKSGRFALTPMAECLRTDAPNSVCAVAIMTGEDWWWKAWGRILHSVQTGKSSFQHVHGMRFFEYMTKNPEAGAIFDRAMASYTAQTGAQVVAAYSFDKARVVVDVGGGHGALLAAILRHHPSVRGIVFDQPATVEIAKGFLESQRLLARCQVLGGDFFESVPEGGDTYLLQHVVHDWDDENATKILRNCHRAMPPDGKLLLVEMVIPFGNRPFLGKFLDLGVLMMENGARERTELEYRNLLSVAGFDVTRIIPLPSPDSVIEAVRKP
ncbi:MAG: methyltransferase [Verrucomicrobiota bacterium]|jgi:SAM-dependent methyltransferase